MKKSILTTILILGIAAGEFSCIAQAKMTKLQKKENYLINVANSGMDSKQYDIAVEYYTKVLEINPQNAEAYAKRGNAKYLLGKYKDAVKDYTKALEIDPNRENAYYNRGLAKANLKAYDDVIEDYNKEL